MLCTCVTTPPVKRCQLADLDFEIRPSETCKLQTPVAAVVGVIDDRWQNNPSALDDDAHAGYPYSGERIFRVACHVTILALQGPTETSQTVWLIKTGTHRTCCTAKTR
jgi:hypothetical protein